MFAIKQNFNRNCCEYSINSLYTKEFNDNVIHQNATKIKKSWPDRKSFGVGWHNDFHGRYYYIINLYLIE